MTLTDYIEEDLKHRILTEEFSLTSLTLANLSDYYKVSAMPVRNAVKSLVEKGYLVKHGSGRISINETKCSSLKKKGVVKPVTAPTDWYSLVRKDVVRRCLGGESSYLRIGEVVEQYGIGRTHAQGILNRLAAEGVLKHTERRGLKIRPVTVEDMDAYLEVRVVLECLALNSVRDKLDKGKLESLLKANSPGQASDAPTIDNSLHRYWVGLSANRYTLDFFDRHGRFYETLYQDAPISDLRVGELAAQHCIILKALLNRRWKEACEVLEEDIRSLKPILLKGMEQMKKLK